MTIHRSRLRPLRPLSPLSSLRPLRPLRPLTYAVLGAVALTGLTPAAAHSAAHAQERFATSRATPYDAVTPDVTSRAAAAAAAVPGRTVRQRTGTVRPAALKPLCEPARPGQEVRFPLFDDVLVKAVETGRERVGGRLIWHGAVPGTTDQTVLVTLAGGCAGKADDAYLGAQFALGGALFAITPTGPSKVTIAETTPLTDEDEQRVVPPHLTNPAPRLKARKAPAAKCKGSAGMAIIDTLVAYTPKALAEAGGDSQIRAQVAKGVALTNEAFATSGIAVRLRLVHTTAVNVPAAYDTVSSAALAAFAQKNTGVADELASLRDKYGADQVSVIVGGTAGGGIGYIPTPPGPAWADWTYTLVAQSAISNYSFGHEIGHNLGSNHDWTTDPKQPDNGASGYFPKAGQFSTLMAYESSCRTSTKGTCGRLNRFSNSAQTYRGLPLGTPLTQTASADSAKVLAANGKAVAGYREGVTDSSLCGVTTSVSPAAAGTVTPGTPGPYAQDATAYFTATPAKGYVFDHWVLDGKAQTSKSTSLPVPTSTDRTLQAVFKKGVTPTAKVTTTVSGGGKVKASTKKSAVSPSLIGTDLLYDAVADPGWSFAGWKLSSGNYAGDLSRVGLRVGASDQGLQAVFAPQVHRLELCAHGHGELMPARAGKYATGEAAIVTAKPAKGWVLEGWRLDGRPYAGTPAGAALVSFADGHDHELTAKFRKK